MKFSASAVAAIAAFAPSLVFATNFTVFVGAGQDGTTGLKFDPQQITAQKGDVVNFEFRGGNHTVTQSSFANPCSWQFNTATQQNGFSSGFVPFNATSGQVGVYSLEITQTDTPIWFFCGRPPHCKSGMYGAINAPTTGNKTFTNFAANVKTTNEPGLGVTVPFTPPGASSGSSSAVAAPTNTPSIVSIPASPTSSGAATPKPSSGAASVNARSAVVLGLAGLVAGIVL